MGRSTILVGTSKRHVRLLLSSAPPPLRGLLLSPMPRWTERGRQKRSLPPQSRLRPLPYPPRSQAHQSGWLPMPRSQPRRSLPATLVPACQRQLFGARPFFLKATTGWGRVHITSRLHPSVLTISTDTAINNKRPHPVASATHCRASPYQGPPDRRHRLPGRERRHQDGSCQPRPESQPRRRLPSPG